jgi:ribonuclease P protein component
LKRFTLSKKERLKSRKRIETLFASGDSFHIFPLRVQFAFTEGDPLQLGVSVPARHFRKAVHRNRVKRLMREAWRLQKTELASLLKEKQLSLAVFLVYTGKDLPEFPLIREKAEQVIARLTTLAHEKIDATA